MPWSQIWVLHFQLWLRPIFDSTFNLWWSLHKKIFSDMIYIN